MIQPITDTTLPTAAAVTPKETAPTAALCKTPFGEVLVDEMSTPNFAALFGPRPAASTVTSKTPETMAALSVAETAAATGSASLKAAASSVPLTNAAGGPTAESLFGAEVFVTRPSGHGPSNTFWSYNPAYFASRQTADVLAKMLGGKVVERNAICPYGPMVQDQVNRMIVLPDGRELNAGLVADIFNHGRGQVQVDQMLKEEVAGAPRPETAV
jgi:hypothetical protein